MCVSLNIKIDINHSHKKHEYVPLVSLLIFLEIFSSGAVWKLQKKMKKRAKRNTHTQWRQMFTFLEKIETIAAADCQSKAAENKNQSLPISVLFIYFF